MAHDFAIKDSGQHEQFASGARRDQREGKGRYDLLPPYAIHRLAQVYEKGAKKYSPKNWALGMPFHLFVDSALRHTFQFLDGATDEDHLGHAIFNLLALIELQHKIDEGALSKELNDLS